LHMHSHACDGHNGLSWDDVIWFPIEFWSEDWETKANFTPDWRTLKPRPPPGPPPSHAFSDASLSSSARESQPPVEVSSLSEVMEQLHEVRDMVIQMQMSILTQLDELRDIVIQTQEQLMSVAAGATEMNRVVSEIQHQLLHFSETRMPYAMPPPPPPQQALAALPRALHPPRQRSRTPVRRSPTPLRFAIDTRGTGGSGGSSGLNRGF
jgi:hypothetical protein